MELFPKQEEFFYLGNKINLFCGGIQSAKTTTGALRFVAHGLSRYQHKDDNFIIAADTYKTLSQATIPTFMKFGSRFGRMNMGLMEFKLKSGGHIYFRTATDPESVEGIPNVRRVWLDEGGKVSLYFWENLEGRAARTEAPIDVTTTPYSMNWLAKMGKSAQTGKRKDVSLVHCKSVDSPYFSRAEYERQRALLDPRRFAMKYEGAFGQMQGLVYDLYEQCLIKSQALPPGTTYYGGIDWGYYPDPFCLVVRAITPERVHFRVAEYYKTHLIMSDIIQVLKSFDGLYRFKLFYCDPSRPDSIAELNRHGLRAVGANNELRTGIDIHYGLMKTNRFWVFEDRCPIGVDEYSSYHYREERELGIEDDLKNKDREPVDAANHGLDGDRYVSIGLESEGGEKRIPIAPDGGGRPSDLSKRLAWLQRGGSNQYDGL